MKLWQYLLCSIIFCFLIYENSNGEIYATRQLPDTAAKGETIEVSINVEITPFSKLLYVKSDDNNVWLRTYSGNYIQKTDTGNADTPVFDSSGKYFAYSDNGIWISQVEGTFKIQMDSTPDAKFPAFSPSGNFLIYLKNSDIYAVYCKTGSNNPKNNDYTYLTDSSANWVEGALEGMQIFNITDGSSGIITYNKSNTVEATLSGGEDNDWDGNDQYIIIGTPYRLTFSSNIEGNLSFSPDESRIIYTGNDGEYSQIFYIPISTSENGVKINLAGEPVNLTTSLSNNEEAKYSKDGTKIIFISERNGKRELFIMNSDGTNQRKINLTPEPDEPAYPEFSNYNENKIIFLDNGKLYEGILDTGESHQIISEITTYKKYDLIQYGTTSIIISETVPDGWTITETSLEPVIPFIFSSSGQPTYKWIVFDLSGNLVELPSFTLTYKIQIPSDADGTYNFSGYWNTGEEEETGGDTLLEVSGFQKGDINEDGEIDISDVILCLRQAVGLDPPTPATSDMNDDGEVDISDVILILRKAVGLD